MPFHVFKQETTVEYTRQHILGGQFMQFDVLLLQPLFRLPEFLGRQFEDLLLLFEQRDILEAKKVTGVLLSCIEDRRTSDREISSSMRGFQHDLDPGMRLTRFVWGVPRQTAIDRNKWKFLEVRTDQLVCVKPATVLQRLIRDDGSAIRIENDNSIGNGV